MIITGKALSDANDVQLQQYALGMRLPTETSKPAHALVLTYTDLARTKNGLFQERAVLDEGRRVGGAPQRWGHLAKKHLG